MPKIAYNHILSAQLGLKCFGKLFKTVLRGGEKIQEAYGQSKLVQDEEEENRSEDDKEKTTKEEFQGEKLNPVSELPHDEIKPASPR